MLQENGDLDWTRNGGALGHVPATLPVMAPRRLSTAPASTGPPRCASLSLGLAALGATSAPIGPPDCRRFAHWPRPAGGEERGPRGGAGQRHSRDGGRRLRTGCGERPGLGVPVPPGASLCLPVPPCSSLFLGTGDEGPVPLGTGVTSACSGLGLLLVAV